MTEASSVAWARAVRATAVLAVDPHGLGGIDLRASVGPVRDAWLAHLDRVNTGSPIRKMPAAIDGTRLLGGLDLAATLSGGRPTATRGILAEADGGILLAAMAERMPSGTAAHLCAALDTGIVVAERDGLSFEAPAHLAVVALDEGEDESERTPASLRDRLAIHLDLRGLSLRDLDDDESVGVDSIRAAREKLPQVTADDAVLHAFCAAVEALGIGSARAPLLALRVARILCALDDRDSVDADDAREAAAMVLAPRATQRPAPSQEEEQEDTDPPDADDTQDEAEPSPAPDEIRPLDDVVLEATQAALPAGLLARLAAGGAIAQAQRGKAGVAQRAAMHGRRIGARAAPLRSGARLDLIATLRAAAPWQRLRGRIAATQPLAIRAGDIRIARFEERARTTTIFLVDASGSSARERLAEAKGAVRLLLADCYIRRDEVALLAFRGTTAELLLPPTRSLVRAERALAALPGGGGTPLATGLDAALLLAGGESRKGRTPTLILMSDGRANVARDGTGGRPRAHEEALAAARHWAASGFAAAFLDTSAAPNPLAGAIAAAMHARYLPLPFATARAVDTAVQSLMVAR